MTQVGAAELVSDYGEFGRCQALREALQHEQARLSLSPDGRHLLVWLSPERRLLSFPHLPAAASSLPPQAGDYLEHSWPAQSPPLCGLLFLQSPGQPWYMALVWENGRAEVWSPPRGACDQRWALLQCVELCRARVTSVCLRGGVELLWCEERTTSNLLTYCLCRRSLRVSGREVSPGAVTILLHHCPPYTVASSPGHVFMVPPAGRHPVLVYAPEEAAVTMATLTDGLIHSKALTDGDADYKKLTLDCLPAAVTRRAQPQVTYCAATGDGRLLVMTAAGRVHLLHQDGTVRHVYRLEGHFAQVRMAVRGDTLVCAADAMLYLIDVRTGRLVAKQVLNAGHVFLSEDSDRGDVQLLTKAGVYRISGAPCSVGGSSMAEVALMDMVYEEACKYYQRRSLSSAKLTVQSLKEDGMFQAPITLSAILNSCQRNGSPKDANKYSELLSNIHNELQSFLSLESLKSRVVTGPEAELAQYRDDLVDLEVTRLLQADLDRDGLVYINSLFNTFPKSAWNSLRNIFQFQQNGDGKLVVRATADLWKKVLSPLPLASNNGVYPLFEVICRSLCTHKPKWLPAFVQHAQDCSGLYWSFTTKEQCQGAPLYKRALSVLKKNTNVDLEVEILLCSGRPQAIIQAIHTLIRLQRWPQVMEETRRYSQLNPLIKKDVFITLLVEFVKNRQLDPYAAQLCDICPDNLTATDILRIVLQNMPKTPPDPPPFSGDAGAHLTLGLLKPLLNKALHRQFENSPSPTFPPAAPRRTNKPASQLPVANGEDMSPTDIYATKAL